MHTLIGSAADGFGLLGAGGVVAPVWHFIGTFHPVIVHFPIALLMVAAFLEGLTVVRRRSLASPALSQSALTCLWLGTAGAVAAAALGWANVDGSGGSFRNDTSLIAVHRWAGIGLAGVAILACVASAMARQRPSVVRRVVAYRGGVMASAALVGLVGMYGGKITHGADHYDNAMKTLVAELRGTPAGATPPVVLASAAPAPAGPVTRPVQVPATQPTPDALALAATELESPAAGGPDHDLAARDVVTATAPTSAPSETSSSTTSASLTRLDYVRDIKPIFDTACAKCHGPEKQKSGYRLDDRAAALIAGDSGERPIVPGRASDSLLVKMIEANGEYADKRMPTKGPPLTGDQIAMIRRWIDEGAE
jgi:uncharacterized membrane protein/mono/diheme cytochrome c family protein